jgi:hypothetical protein
MSLLADYSLADVFWSMLWFFFFFIFIYLFIVLLSDIFRSHDLSGWGKALWVIFLVVLPLFGCLVYLIARGGSMHERAAAETQRQEAKFRQYVQEAAAPSAGTSTADELVKLADLKEKGVLDEAEYQQLKAKALA